MSEVAKNNANLIIVYIPLYFNDKIEPVPKELVKDSEMYNYNLIDTSNTLIELRQIRLYCNFR